MKYLLDTNICVFVIRQKPALVLQRFLALFPSDVAISSITLAELRYGADKSSAPARNHAALVNFVTPIPVLDFNSSARTSTAGFAPILSGRGRQSARWTR